MPGSTSFFQGCPICGRALQVRVELLGRNVACPHCRGEFVASDEPATARDQPILERANELLNWLPNELIVRTADSCRDVG
jgi:hypothetical protein